VERPLPPDPRLKRNETPPLCAGTSREPLMPPAAAVPEAWADFRSRLVPLVPDGAALILLSTDGYANSFSSDEAFLRVGGDLLGMIRGNGLEAVGGQLEGWLSEASRQGSGDDVTLGIVHHAPAASSPAALAEGRPPADP